jgi:Spy/CpxP family protein refolding chaperone
MKSTIVLAICALALPLAAATVATAAHKKGGKPHHHHHHKGKACKGEFHYFKGGKCQDSRKKK